MFTPAEKYKAAVKFYIENLTLTGTSPATITNYQGRLDLFGGFFSAKNPENDPTYADVKAWRDSLVEKGLAPSTVRQYLNELKYFFDAVSDPDLEEEKFYEKNPVGKRLTPKVPKRPYDLILTDEQVSLLWKNKPAYTGLNWIQNYAMVILFLTSKIRNAELRELRLCDLDFENEEITIESGKGNKFRVVDFSFIAQTAIKLYLASGLRPVTLSDEAPLFGNFAENKKNGKRTGCEWHSYSSQAVSEKVRRHVLAVTGVDNVRSHDLRHVGSRLDLNSGTRSMEALQSELGHASMNTTQIYSGKLLQRRARKSAMDVFAERDAEAKRNQMILENFA